LTVTPISGNLSVTNPDVVLSGLSLTPDIITGLLTIIDPSVQSGGLNLTPDVIAGNVTTNSPTVNLGSLTLVPNVLSGQLEVAGPFVPDSIIFTPMAIAIILATINPSIPFEAIRITLTDKRNISVNLRNR
jgi:hypothetical protein